MSYKKDLENATNFEECQAAYDKECSRRYKKFEKELGASDAFTKMTAIDYSIWSRAQERLVEIYPELANSFDPDDCIVSRY